VGLACRRTAIPSYQITSVSDFFSVVGRFTLLASLFGRLFFYYSTNELTK